MNKTLPKQYVCQWPKIDVPIARPRRWMQHSARIDIWQDEDGALWAGGGTTAHHVRADSTLQLCHFSFGSEGTDILIQFLAAVQQGLGPRARRTTRRIAAHDDDDATNKRSRTSVDCLWQKIGVR
jgi:hypothetical protein